MRKYNNSKIRKAKWLELIEKRGRRCEDTGSTSAKNGKPYAKMSLQELSNYLVLHEIDDDPKNLSDYNLLILSKSANLARRLKEGRFRYKLLRHKAVALDYTYTRDGKIDVGYESFKRNANGQPLFREWLNNKLEERPILTKKWVVDNGAAVAGVTIITLEKVWLPSMTSEEDDYELIQYDDKDSLTGKVWCIQKRKQRIEPELEKAMIDKYTM